MWHTITTKSAKSPKGDYLRIDNFCMRITAYNLLPYGLGAVAEEEEAARYAVNNLVKGVDACDRATYTVAINNPVNGHPTILPAEKAQSISQV